MPADTSIKAVQLVQSGLTYEAAARIIGVSRSAVAGACWRAGLRVGYRPRTPEGMDRFRAGMQAAKDARHEVRKAKKHAQAEALA